MREYEVCIFDPVFGKGGTYVNVVMHAADVAALRDRVVRELPGAQLVEYRLIKDGRNCASMARSSNGTFSHSRRKSPMAVADIMGTGKVALA